MLSTVLAGPEGTLRELRAHSPARPCLPLVPSPASKELLQPVPSLCHATQTLASMKGAEESRHQMSLFSRDSYKDILLASSDASRLGRWHHDSP